MRHFLSHCIGRSRRERPCPRAHAMVNAISTRNIYVIVLLASIALLSSSWAQVPVPTSRGDNARSGANTNETLLAPSNVNKNGFGHLFSTPVDYVVMAQPLYVPNVNIPGQGIHNVVYVVTQADSVYAIDADTGTQLWYASVLDGGTTASGTNLPCGTSVGFYQEGIPGTPVIDPTTNTMYLVAKTVRGGVVRHDLHALDITTGNDQPGSPVQIIAQTTSLKGTVMNFVSKWQKNRPGLLLVNGTLYMGFGSNLCNGNDSGWVMSYDTSTLTPLNVFNTSPDYGLTSIWQTGNGLAADADGNLFVTTAETGSHGFDVPSGGQTYCNSVVKLSSDLQLADFFTPWSVAYLNVHDLDVSSAGALILPDQNGPFPHEVVAGGKQGVIYVLDRDSMGGYSTNDVNIIQEFPVVPNPNDLDVLMSSPAYWNNSVYFTPKGNPLMAFPLINGQLGTPLKTVQKYPGSHSPSISANGNTNGILWAISGTQLLAFDAVSLNLLYTSGQAANNRDKLPPVGHFVTQTVANGKVFVATNASLEAYGLFHVVSITGGTGQTATVGTTLAAPIQVQVVNPYNGQPDVGATVNFSDGGKGGSFTPAAALIDANGYASTFYKVPTKAGVYTITISGIGFSTVTTTATATAGAAIKIIAYGGAKQTGPAGSNLPSALVAQAQDVYKNGVAGVTVNFSANKGAIPNPSSVVTDPSGLARTILQLPTTVSTITVTGSASGFKNISYAEYSVAGPAFSVSVTGGNYQFAPAGTQLPQPLTVVVADQYGNPVSGVSVTFNDADSGGSFFNPNPAVTNSSGVATQLYTLPPVAGTITINATASGVTNPAVFTETGQ